LRRAGGDQPQIGHPAGWTPRAQSRNVAIRPQAPQALLQKMLRGRLENRQPTYTSAQFKKRQLR
jgi:hypothetical protein